MLIFVTSFGSTRAPGPTRIHNSYHTISVPHSYIAPRLLHGLRLALGRGVEVDGELGGVENLGDAYPLVPSLATGIGTC